MIQGLFKPQHNGIIKMYTLVNYKICIFLFQTILKQLTDMGFKETRAKKALFLNRCCIVVYSLVGKVLTNLQWLLRDFVTELLWYCKSWDTSRGKIMCPIQGRISESQSKHQCLHGKAYVCFFRIYFWSSFVADYVTVWASGRSHHKQVTNSLFFNITFRPLNWFFHPTGSVC